MIINCSNEKYTLNTNSNSISQEKKQEIDSLSPEKLNEHKVILLFQLYQADPQKDNPNKINELINVAEYIREKMGKSDTEFYNLKLSIEETKVLIDSFK